MADVLCFVTKTDRNKYIKNCHKSLGNAEIGRRVGLARETIRAIRRNLKTNRTRSYIDVTCPKCGKERTIRKDSLETNPEKYCRNCSKKEIKTTNNKYYMSVSCPKCGEERVISKQYYKSRPICLCRSCSKKGKPSPMKNVIHKPLEKITVICTMCGKQMIMGRKSWIKGKKRCKACTAKTYGVLERGLATKRELYGRYKSRSKKRGIEFTLPLDMFVSLTSKSCYYCGAKPNNTTVNESGNGDYVNNGLDKVDNDKGYIENNVVPCCKICNYAKNTMGLNEFYAWVDKIYNNLTNKGVLNEPSSHINSN